MRWLGCLSFNVQNPKLKIKGVFEHQLAKLSYIIVIVELGSEFPHKCSDPILMSYENFYFFVFKLQP